MKNNLYKLLGVSENATQKEIIKAFHVIARKLHPDLHPEGQSEKDVEKFKETSQAFSVLSNPKLRQEYDSSVKENKVEDFWEKAGKWRQYSVDELNDLLNTFEKLFSPGTELDYVVGSYGMPTTIFGMRDPESENPVTGGSNIDLSAEEVRFMKYEAAYYDLLGQIQNIREGKFLIGELNWRYDQFIKVIEVLFREGWFSPEEYLEIKDIVEKNKEHLPEMSEKEYRRQQREDLEFPNPPTYDERVVEEESLKLLDEKKKRKMINRRDGEGRHYTGIEIRERKKKTETHKGNKLLNPLPEGNKIKDKKKYNVRIREERNPDLRRKWRDEKEKIEKASLR